jgi:hypothetical protein
VAANVRLHMHTSLHPRTNIWLLVIWGVAAAAVTSFASPVPWPFLGFGSVIGVCLGILQLKALRASSSSFLKTRTAMEVRRAFGSSMWGRLYLWSFWVSSIALLGAAIFLLPEQAFVAFFGSYSAFAFARELLALRGIFELQKLSSEGGIGRASAV